ncbi:hypothetical protein PICSAR10_04515 [Mycobacterium avium subsp. paratuberculosis]|nr:hypothetical protein PICSAR10_04515 [Mycobacterium avium subsp. paratuberculosis]
MARTAPTGDGAVSATSCSDPPRIHSETTRPPEPVCTTSSTRAMPGLSMRLSRSVRDRISCSTSSGRARSGSTKVSATCRSRAVSRACQNCSGGAPPWNTSNRYRPPAMRAPGTRWTSSVDESAVRSRGTSNGPRRVPTSPFFWSAGRGSALRGRSGWSAGMSGWKSSATGRGAPDPVPGPALDAALSIGRSVTSGPFTSRARFARSGGLRRIGSWTAFTPGGDEFLCSGYVTGRR